MLVLSFSVAANRYAVDATRIVEVVPNVPLRTIPHAPACLTGLLGYRGRVVPVLDLGLLLGIAPCQNWLSTRIIVVSDAPGGEHDRTRGRATSQHEIDETKVNRKPDPALLGLVAEHVNDLIYTRPDQIIPAPVSLPQTPYLGEVIQTDQGIVQLIVVEHVRAASMGVSSLSQQATWSSSSEPSTAIG